MWFKNTITHSVLNANFIMLLGVTLGVPTQMFWRCSDFAVNEKRDASKHKLYHMHRGVRITQYNSI